MYSNMIRAIPLPHQIFPTVSPNEPFGSGDVGRTSPIIRTHPRRPTKPRLQHRSLITQQRPRRRHLPTPHTYNGAVTGARARPRPTPSPPTSSHPNPPVPPSFPPLPQPHHQTNQHHPALSTNPSTNPSISQTNIPTAPRPHHGCTCRSATM